MSGIFNLSQLFKYVSYYLTIDVDTAELSRSVAILSSIIIFIFVWLTYSQKVVENHSDKASPESLQTLRRDVRIFCQLLSRKYDENFRKMQIAMAFMVGLVMLAITSFIRVFFHSAKDVANLESGGVSRAGASELHFNFGLSYEKADFLVFAVIVFCVVYLMCRRAIRTGKWLNRKLEAGGQAATALNEATKRRLILNRIAEPILVFVCLGMAMDHLFGLSITSPSTFAIKLIFSLGLSAVMTSLLVFFNGWSNIRNAVVQGYGSELPQKIPDRWADQEANAASFIKVLLGLLTALLVTFYLSHRGDISNGTGLSRFLRILTVEAGMFSLIVLYVPAKKMIDWEERLNAKFFEHTHTYTKAFGYSLAIFVILLVHMSLIDALPSGLLGKTVSNTTETLRQIAAILGVTFFLIALRSKTLLKVNKSVNLAEWLAAFALSILLIEVLILGH